MKIVSGRGNRRSVVEIPTGQVVDKAPASEREAFVSNVCRMLGVR